jgi:fructose-1,6-bisphosphatase/inositol monophosphatase family enzyme
MGKMFVAQPTGVYGTHYPLFSRVFAQILSEYGVKIREFGASAALCYVAQGSVDFAFGNSGLEWDYFPTFLICQEAGLTVTDREGKPWQIGRQDYIIANAPVHTQLLSYFKQ